MTALEPLQATTIEEMLEPPAAAMLESLWVHGSIESTNAALLRQAPPQPRRGRVCLAEAQSSGRGRRGRRWTSPFGRNIYLSLDWCFSGGAARLQGLSLAAGVAVAEALAALGYPAVGLKWPNDLLVDGAKLGGILVEMSGDAAGVCHVVLGVGINVAMPADSAADIDQSWTDLCTLRPGIVPSRNAVAASLVNALLPLLANYEQAGFASWRERWLRRDALAGCAVVVGNGDRALSGTARGVDERGALLLDTDTGRQALLGGELSLRARP
jgi:BirA family biotin operon repressor/biotin-[acetyl-CoA-carboxylase] ligase